MKIFVDYKNVSSSSTALQIVSAEYLSDFVVKIRFNDGIEQIVDFKPFLKKSLHPDIQKYTSEDQFSKFVLEDGNLNWNDFEMIFPIIDLYRGVIR